jgi:hypothetical protein
MARRSLETANSLSPSASNRWIDIRTLNDEIHASAAPISYEEQNSTITRQLEIAGGGFGVGVFGAPPREERSLVFCKLIGALSGEA